MFRTDQEGYISQAKPLFFRIARCNLLRVTALGTYCWAQKHVSGLPIVAHCISIVNGRKEIKSSLRVVPPSKLLDLKRTVQLILDQFVTSWCSVGNIRLKSITRRPLFVKINLIWSETNGCRANVHQEANFRIWPSPAIVIDYHPLQAKLFMIPITLAAPVLFEFATLLNPALLRQSTTFNKTSYVISSK